MTVYVVLGGHDYAGEYLLGVFATREAAEQLARDGVFYADSVSVRACAVWPGESTHGWLVAGADGERVFRGEVSEQRRYKALGCGDDD